MYIHTYIYIFYTHLHRLQYKDAHPRSASAALPIYTYMYTLYVQRWLEVTAAAVCSCCSH